MSTLHPADTPPRAEPVAQPAASPMGPTPSRCASLDAVRGLAVLGILAMNITSFASPSSAYMDPRVQGFAGVDRASWWIVHLLFDVKMMTIFSALFGAGIALMADRALRASGRPAVLHYRRMFWLLLVGLAHAYLLWYGDILVLYALCGMLVYPLRRLRPRTLIVLGLAIMLVTPLVNVAMGGGLTLMRGYAEGLERRQEQGQTLTPDQERDLAGWHEIEKQFTTPPQRVEEEIAAHTTSYPAYLQHNARLAFWMQTKITLMWSIWRVTGLMLIGMALLKTGFLLGQAPPRLYLRLAAVGYAVGFPVVALGALDLIRHDFDMVRGMLVSWHFNYVGSLLVSLAHASLVILACLSGRAICRALAPVGQMALTNYLFQSIVCVWVFAGFGAGLGLFNRLGRTELLLFVAGVWVLQLILSPIWLKRYHFGPAEWAWRSLTYARPQPMLRAP